MANPAALLHVLLTNWRTGYPNDFAPQYDQRMAARHIDAIASLLDEMDMSGRRTDHYRKHFDQWCHLTLHHPHGWAPPQKTHIDDIALEGLDHLGDRLDDIVAKIQPGGLDQLRGYADSARALLDEDEDLDPLLKQHVRQVIAHLVWCIDNYAAVGDFALEDAVERLISCIVRTAATFEKDDTANRSKWKEWMDRIAWPFAVNIVAAIPSNALSQLALGM